MNYVNHNKVENLKVSFLKLLINPFFVNFMISFLIFFFIYLKTFKNLSAKYQQEN